MTASKDEYPNIIHETFIRRVSNFSIVNHSLMTLHQAYSRTKNSNRVIKYSIESVESKVLGFAQPIISTMSPALQPLDRFANSALDRVLELASDSNEFVGSGMVNTHVLIQQSIAAIESQLRLISEIVMSRRDELSQHSVQVADVISQAQSTIVSSLKAVIGGLMSLSYLPDAAKHNIRLFILAFPQRLVFYYNKEE
jgi:hypothetical protein